MNRLSRLVESIATVKSSWDAIFLKNLEEKWGDEVTAFPYKKSDLCYVCISATSRAISQVPLRIYQKINKAGDVEPVNSDHPWQKLLDRPNSLMDSYSFKEALIGYLMLDGDVWIVPFPPRAKIPAALWVVKEKYMSPIRNQRTGQLDGWRYRPGENVSDSTSYIFGPHEVVHIWFWNPYDPIMGLSPIEAGKMSIVTDYKAAYYNQVFFDEGAVPGGILSTEQKLSDKTFNRIKEQFESRHKGYRKGYRLAVVEQGLKYTQSGITQKDMEYLDLRRYNQKRIMQIFGMKEVIISVSEDINYAIARELRKEWWHNTNLPMMRLLTSAMNFIFFQNTNLEVRFDISAIEALQEDYKEKVNMAKTLTQAGFTGNEINEKLQMGFKPKPWRDKWWAPLNVVPVGDDGELPPEEDGKITSTSIIESKGSYREKRLENLWKLYTKNLSPIEKQFESRVKRSFFDMRKRTLELLYQGEKQNTDTLVKTIEDISGEEFRDILEKLKEHTGPLYEQALDIGIKSFEEETGAESPFGLDDSALLGFLAVKVQGIVRSGNTIKRRILEQIMEGLEKGEGIDQLAERIRGEYNTALSRAKLISRTEVAGTGNFARHEAINRSGFRRKQWWTALDERVRSEHMQMHGAEINVGDSWIMPDSSVLRYPGDYLGPAHQIINCRCMEICVAER